MIITAAGAIIYIGTGRNTQKKSMIELKKESLETPRPAACDCR